MPEGNSEHIIPPTESVDINTQPQKKHIITSPGKFKRLRELVRERQVEAQQRFQKDTKREEPLSSFLGIAVDKTRADLKAEYDQKTGLRNHESFYNETEREIARVNRNPELHGLIIGVQDIDSFGSFNSTYGELTGDKALKAVADALTSSIRETDIAGRWGGEEFAFTLPFDKENPENAPTDFFNQRRTTDLTAPGERIRQSVENIPVSEDIPRPLTVSVGMSEYDPGETFDQCFERASLASLIAKLTNKNRAIIARKDSRTDEWLFHDVTNQLVYKTIMSPDGKRLLALEDITQNIPYAVEYLENQKPKLVKAA